MPGDFQRLTADVAAGDLIGPFTFTEGRVVRIRTGVETSRDHSELSAGGKPSPSPPPRNAPREIG